MKRSGRLRRRTRLRHESEKRAAERSERETIRSMALMRDHYRCRAERLVPAVHCAGPLDAHEIIPRSAWPGGHLVLDNVLTVCRAHHRWIDANPTDAAAAGLHGYSYERGK